MDKLIEIDGRWIQVKSKSIEINCKEVITQGEIKILDSIDSADINNHANSLDRHVKHVQLAAREYQPTNDFFEQQEA